MTPLPLLLLASVLGSELSPPQTDPKGAAGKRQTVALEAAAILTQACKDFIDADTTSVSRFEELGLVRKSDGSPDMQGNQTVSLSGHGVGVVAGTIYALQLNDNWRYSPNRVQTKTCVVSASLESQADADALASKIAQMLGRRWTLQQGRYVIEYSKNRMVHITTHLSNFGTKVVFTKVIQ